MTRGLWRVGGSFLTVLLLGWGTANVVAQISFDSRSFTRVVTTPVRVVDVHVGAGSIDVVAVPGSSRVVVHGEVERGLVDTNATFAVRGDRVEIHASCPVVLNQNCKARYRVEVPPAVQVIAHAGGHVRVTGTTGSLAARADQGRVTLTDVSGPLDVHSSQGSVSGSGLRSTDVHASSSQGDVDLTFVRDPDLVDVSASQGDVRVVVPADHVAYAVDASASQGSAHVRVPTDEAASRRVTARASQGDVTVEPGG
jgi:ribosomal protein S28E/S33